MRKKIYVAFYKTNAPKASIIDKIIGWYTNSDYSHVELIIDGYQYSSSPRDKHVRKKIHKFDNNSWHYHYIELDIEDINNILYFYQITKGFKYDWLGIFGFIFPIQDRTKAYFCSEWCTKALQVASYDKVFLLEPYKTSPGHLAKTIKG